MSETEKSPIMDTGSPETKKDAETSSYTIILAIIVVILVLFIIYHAYSCFCINQNLDFSEPYINKQPRTDPQDDNAFDVESEVKKLIQLQEQYLEKQQRSRMGN